MLPRVRLHTSPLGATPETGGTAPVRVGHADPVPTHDDEIEIDVATVRAMVDTRFPKWGGQSIVRVGEEGTVNAMPGRVMSQPRSGSRAAPAT
jgi:hypothetical protein